MFDHVSFTYPGAAEPVLRDIVLDLPPGQTVVLTGATGSGKSTLLQLVSRLTDATSGSVRLDGTDVRDLPLERLRSAVGFAFEDATLFSASVRENVMFGAPDADADAVEAALTAAQARFAFELPWGLDTRIGEQGMALSGGQRQRIALARAIFHYDLNWLPNAAGAALAGDIARGFGGGGGEHAFRLLTWWQGGLVMLLWGLVPLSVGYFTTFRRDVT